MSKPSTALFASVAALALSAGFLAAAGAANADCTIPSGVQFGIVAVSFGGGNVTITTSAPGGDVVVSANPPTTTTSVGVEGCAVDPGTVTITLGASVTSNDGSGVIAITENAANTITQNAGVISANGGPGILGNASGTGAVTINTAAGSSVVSTGGGFAVEGISSGGPVALTLDGAVSGGEGVLGLSSGAGGVSVNIGGPVSATGGDGVAAVSADGAASVLVQSGGTVAAAGNGVVAEASGLGAVTVVDNGAINSVGTGVFAAAGGGGAVTVAVNGAVTSTTGSAVETFATTGTTAILVGPGASVHGADDTVSATSTAGPISLSNGGGVATSVPGHAGVAVAVSGPGGFSLNNAAGGLIDGRVEATDGVVFKNAGVWKFTGVSDFGTAAGAATNSITNTGMIQTVLDGPTSASSASSLAHLGAFQNGTATSTGLVSLLNGHVGDSLTISGLFTGATGHSVLAEDAFLSGPGSTADQVHLLGGSAGRTEILIHDTNTGFGGLNPFGIVLVTGVSHPGNFILDPASPNYDARFGGIDHGFFLYTLRDRAGTAELTSRFNIFGGHLPFLLSSVQQIFDAADVGALTDTSGAPADRLAFAGDGAEAPRVWMSASNWRPDALSAGRQSLWSGQLPDTGAGLASAVEVNQTFLSRSFDGAEPSLAMDAGYAQSTASLVSGVDLVRERGEGHAFVAGLLTGYVQSDQAFRIGGDIARYGGPIVGVYSSYKLGALRLDGDVRGDLLRATYLGQGADSVSSGAANVFGAELNASYSQPLGDRWTLSPTAGFTVSSASITGLKPFGQALHFSGGQSAQAAVGMRLNGDLSVRRWTIGLSAAAKVTDELAGVNTVEIAEAPGMPISSRLAGLSSDFDARLDVAHAGGRFSAFVGGAYRISSRVTEAVMTSGVALTW